MWNERDRIVNQPIVYSLISLAIPAVGSSLFYVIFEIVDMYWVGRLGANPVAALSAASFFIWMLRALAQTVATGVIATVSRNVGRNDKTAFLRTAVHAFTSTFVFTCALIVILAPLIPHLFRWIRLEQEIASLAAEYAGVFLSGLLFVYLLVTTEHILRGSGNTKIPMIVIGSALLLNAVLDPVFIFHFKMGLRGAAYATILAHFIGSLVIIIVLLRKYPELRSQRVHLSSGFFRDYFFPFIRIGTPIALSGASFSVIYLVLSGIISIHGNAPLAALGIGHRLEAFPFFVAFGFSMATATMVGQNLGAEQPEKAKASALTTLGITSLILLIVSLIFFFFGDTLYDFFISDPEVKRHGVNYIRIIAIFEVFLAPEVVLEGAFSGAGDTRPPLLVIFPATFLRIPLSYLFSVVLGFGVTAIWFVISITTFIKGTALFFWFNTNRWMKTRV